MIYLYLDESGDLGFDFFAKKPSKFFTVAILAVKGVDNNRALINAVRKTIRRKLPQKTSSELKGRHSWVAVGSDQAKCLALMAKWRIVN